VFQLSTRTGEQSGLLTHIAKMESVSLFGMTKSYVLSSNFKQRFEASFLNSRSCEN